MAADKLSVQIGMAKTYLGKWERDRRSVNKQSLHKVCEAMSLSPAERQQLFHLADQRLGIDWAQYNTGNRKLQVILYLGQCLSAVPHTFDNTITKDAFTFEFTFDASFVVAYAAIGTDKDLDPMRLAWPPFIYDLDIISISPDDRKHLTPIPADLIQETFANIPPDVGELTKDLALKIAAAMAETYRIWLLSDLDRCSKAVSGIQRWDITNDKMAGPLVSFSFNKNIEIECSRVRPVVAGRVFCRELEQFIWNWSNKRQDEFNGLPDRLLPDDFKAYHTYISTQAWFKAINAREHEAAITLKPALQDIRDSYFTLNAGSWDYCRQLLKGIIAAAAESLPPEVVALQVKMLFSGTQLGSKSGCEDLVDAMRFAFQLAERRICQEPYEQGLLEALRKDGASSDDLELVDSFGGLSPHSLLSTIQEAINPEQFKRIMLASVSPEELEQIKHQAETENTRRGTAKLVSDFPGTESQSSEKRASKSKPKKPAKKK